MKRRSSTAAELPANTVQPLGDIEPAALRAWAAEQGQQLVEIDLRGCRDKTEVLQAIAAALALPSWFGANLDALYDALTDLPGRDTGAGYVIVLDRLPATRSFGAGPRRALLDVFRDVAEDYAQAGVAFRVLTRD
jgi:RNAse (barnase) inhibitor barstar